MHLLFLHSPYHQYEPDSNTWTTNAMFLIFSNYTGISTKAIGQTKPDPYSHPFGSYLNPYLFGHIPEVTPNKDGTATVKKHFCLGRISHELIRVMPDMKTVMMGDDTTNSGIFAFIADKPKDLSSGSLYVAKLDNSGSTSPKFSLDTSANPTLISWIKLGSATSAEVEGWAKMYLLPDIMAVRTSDPADATFTKIWVNGAREWVKLVPGMERQAAFLETHRYAALMGGTLQFTKMEGCELNAKDKITYLAIQNAQSSMVAGDVRNNPSHFGLAKAVIAGAVIQMQLGSGAKLTDGTVIASDWFPLSVKVCRLLAICCINA